MKFLDARTMFIYRNVEVEREKVRREKTGGLQTDFRRDA